MTEDDVRRIVQEEIERALEKLADRLEVNAQARMDESKVGADLNQRLIHEQGTVALLAVQDAIVKTLLQMVSPYSTGCPRAGYGHDPHVREYGYSRTLEGPLPFYFRPCNLPPVLGTGPITLVTDVFPTNHKLPGSGRAFF